MSLLLNKHKAAVILGKERAREAGENVTPKKQGAKTVSAAAAKLGTYSHTAKKKKK